MIASLYRYILCLAIRFRIVWVLGDQSRFGPILSMGAHVSRHLASWCCRTRRVCLLCVCLLSQHLPPKWLQSQPRPQLVAEHLSTSPTPTDKSPAGREATHCCTIDTVFVLLLFVVGVLSTSTLSPFECSPPHYRLYYRRHDIWCTRLSLVH